MKKASVIGKPIGHSLSPSIFMFLSQKQDFQYSSEEIESYDLTSFIKNFQNDPEMIGLNVTIPHKEAVVSQLNEQSPEVKITGAANVIHKAEGKLIGYNTDIHGILMTLKDQAGSLAGKRAWVLGAGGAAKAALYALGELKLKQVDLINRTPERALKLVEQMRRYFPSTEWKVASWQNKSQQSIVHFEPGPPFALCINATPLGMGADLRKDSSAFVIPLFNRIFAAQSSGLKFEKDAVAFDFIYRPENTPFLSIARRHGLKTIGGLEMLVDQALAAWKIWFKNSPAQDDQKQPLLNFLRNRPLFLTGFMGAGKSTVGEILARRLLRNFIDLDRAIESKANKSVGQIFEESGEAAFREMEYEEFKKNFLSPNLVLALGGGTLLNPQIRTLIQKVGTLVYLKTTPPILAHRIRDHHIVRPLLENTTDLEQEAKIKELLKARESFYLQAPIQVDTDILTPDEIAAQISGMME
jgi:shikimate dehydrogenase